MSATMTKLLGWIDHSQRMHPGQGTILPAWLGANLDDLHDAVKSGFVQQIGLAPYHASRGLSFSVYGLTEKGLQYLFGKSQGEAA